MKSKILLISILILTIGIANLVVSQNYNADPLYGSYSLSAGFTPDPYSVDVSAGGSDAVTISGCNGYINSSAPDVRLSYTSGSYDLTFYVISDNDTTLLINKPDTSWACNDDTYNYNPAVTVTNPSSGQYDVWIGVYGSSDIYSATLFFTELSPDWNAR